MAEIKFRMCARINMGAVRKNNEDNFIVSTNVSANSWIINNDDLELDKKGALFVVADGMGGMNAGEVASGIVVESVKRQFTDLGDEVIENTQTISSFLAEVIKNADKEIVQHAKENPETKGMGTTVVMIWIIDKMAYVAWCGDSRAYMYHPDMGLKQVSKDHSYVQELVDKGVLTSEQAFYHPDSNIVTRSLGSESVPAVPDVVSVELYDNLRFVLCSDGLNSMLTDENIQSIVAENSDIMGCNDILIDEAIKAGGHDNITVILTDIISGAGVYVPEVKENIVNSVIVGRDNSKLIKNIIIAAVAVIIIAVSFFAGGKYYAKKDADKVENKDTVVIGIPAINGVRGGASFEEVNVVEEKEEEEVTQEVEGKSDEEEKKVEKKEVKGREAEKPNKPKKVKKEAEKEVEEVTTQEIVSPSKELETPTPVGKTIIPSNAGLNPVNAEQNTENAEIKTVIEDSTITKINNDLQNE